MILTNLMIPADATRLAWFEVHVAHQCPARFQKARSTSHKERLTAHQLILSFYAWAHFTHPK